MRGSDFIVGLVCVQGFLHSANRLLTNSAQVLMSAVPSDMLHRYLLWAHGKPPSRCVRVTACKLGTFHARSQCCSLSHEAADSCQEVGQCTIAKRVIGITWRGASPPGGTRAGGVGKAFPEEK